MKQHAQITFRLFFRALFFTSNNKITLTKQDKMNCLSSADTAASCLTCLPGADFRSHLALLTPQVSPLQSREHLAPHLDGWQKSCWVLRCIA